MRFRHLLVALLVFALPLQGAVASSRWLCAASAPAAGAAHDHRSAHAAAARHESGHDGVTQHERAVLQESADAGYAMSVVSTDAGQPVAASAAAADAGCNLCAACSVTAAAPPAPIVVAAGDRAEPPFFSPPALVPQVAAVGPERPPRTV